MKKEILNIILTIDTSTAKGMVGAGLLSLIEPARALGVILGLLLLIMSIIEKYLAIRKIRKG